MAMARAEARQEGPLRPRNVSVPSYRPPQSAGCAGPARPCVPGAGEGPHTATRHDYRCMYESRSGCPIKGKGSG